MELIFLADKPGAIPLIARWYFDEWGHRVKENTVEKIQARIEGMLNRDKIPVHILAVDGEKVLGVSQLKIREMDIYPEKEHWLGGVFVAPEVRGKGLGATLVLKALELAKGFEVKTLYLQTERLNGGLYARLGWQPIERVRYNGLHVLVMQRPVDWPLNGHQTGDTAIKTWRYGGSDRTVRLLAKEFRLEGYKRESLSLRNQYEFYRLRPRPH